MNTVLYNIGLVCTAVVGYRIFGLIFNFLYDSLVAPALNLQKIDWNSFGKWAVITGSTDGIGKAYAEALAKKGLNIVLISRNQSKLDAVASEIEGSYKVEVRTIAVDFTIPDTIYHEIDKHLASLEIGVLVNNVGMSYEHPEYFLDYPNGEQSFRNMMNCNMLSVVGMCKIVMPGMVERKRGIVINIASTAGIIPNPMVSIYAGSKAFVCKFSSDLAAEYHKDNIIIQCVNPGYVATSMSKIRNSTWMSPSPETFVASAIRTVGISESTTGYFPHTLLQKFINTLDCISPKLSRWLVIRTMQNIRNRALKKKATRSNS